MFLAKNDVGTGEEAHGCVDRPYEKDGVEDLDAYFVYHGVDRARQGRHKGQVIRTCGRELRGPKRISKREVFQRDDEDASRDETDSQHAGSGEGLSNEQGGPDLSEKRGRAGDGIDQGEVGSPIGPDQTENVEGLYETGEKHACPELGGELREEGGKGPEPKEKREVKQRAEQKDPEEEFQRPIPFFGKKIPRGVEEGGGDDEKDAERCQGWVLSLCR